MARPSIPRIVSGQEAWDEEHNSALDVLDGAPFPLFQVTASTSLAAFTALYPAAQYDRCLAWLNDSTFGYVLVWSDGANWQYVGRPKTASLASASALVAVNAATLGDRGTLRTGLTENMTYSNPTGGFDGQVIFLEPKQHASTGPYTVAFGTKYRATAGLPLPTMSNTASARDVYMFKYHSGDDKWDLMAIIQGIV